MSALLCAAVFLSGKEFLLQPDGDLHIHFLDVDQGDAALLISPSGKQIVIDGGPNLALLEHLGKHMPFFDRTIDLVILTHPDSDHLTALPQLLERYHVGAITMAGVQHGSGRYDALLHHIKEYNIPVVLSDPTRDIDVGDGLVLDIVWPLPDVFGTHPKNANDPSFVIRALYGAESILLTGDIELEAEKEILVSGADISSRVIKVAHHGSRTSSFTGFLLAVNPELGIISSGKDNSFGHPHPEIVERYEQMGIRLRNTVDEGTISLTVPKL